MIVQMHHSLGGSLHQICQIGRERAELDIERINDHTVKFYISYIDIEERGFNREEIWYNREKKRTVILGDDGRSTRPG
ncbi:hypothetical protein GCM10020331_078360 [Ectobacillus funiculus]